MKFASSQDHGDSITAHFDNGSAVKGRLVVACDGANSRLRKEIFGKQGYSDLQPSPFRMLGVKMRFSPEDMVEFRKCDPFFLHGTNCQDSTFGYFSGTSFFPSPRIQAHATVKDHMVLYSIEYSICLANRGIISVLDAPGNTEASTDKFLLQICISWLEQPGFMGKEEAVTIPETNEARVELFRSLASSWTDPFRSLAMSATSEDEVKGLELKEWVPPKDLRSKGRAVLMGDSLHTMTMCKFTNSFFIGCTLSPWRFSLLLSYPFLLFFFGPAYRFLVLSKTHYRYRAPGGWCLTYFAPLHFAGESTS